MDEKGMAIRWTRTGPPPSETLDVKNNPRRAPRLTKMKNVALFSDLFSSPQRVDGRHVKGVQVLYGHGGATWVDRNVIGPENVSFKTDLKSSVDPFKNTCNKFQKRMWETLDVQ